MKVQCSKCKNMVELKDGYLRQHRETPGLRSRSGWCDNGGVSEQVNERMVEGVDPGVPARNPGSMHEPKPYTHDLDWHGHTMFEGDTVG